MEVIMADTGLVKGDSAPRLRSLVDRFFGEEFPHYPLSRFWDDGLLPVDISQDDHAVIVRASVPGFKKDEVDVHISNGILSIKAERTSESESSHEHYYRKERSYGAMSRRVVLPGIVGDAEAEARLEDGVLTVRVAVSEEAKPKRVAIAD
jgi:HSP20 family protein